MRIYRVSNAAQLLAEVDRPTDVPGAMAKLLALEAEGSQSRLGDGVRQVLTELRGAPPSAIVLLSDGQTTEGEPLSKAPSWPQRKGVPLLHDRPGKCRAGPRYRADRAPGRRRRLRRRRRAVSGQAVGPRLRGRKGHGAAQGARAGLERPGTAPRARIEGSRAAAGRPAQARRADVTIPRRRASAPSSSRSTSCPASSRPTTTGSSGS